MEKYQKDFCFVLLLYLHEYFQGFPSFYVETDGQATPLI